MAVNPLVVMTVRLWLVRHGRTDWSDAGRLCGWSNVPLNARGRAQAVRLGERLVVRNVTSAWTSDLDRARETAELAFVDAMPDARLRELNFGALEGLTWDACPPAIREALLGFEDFAAPGGESVDDLSRRVADFIRSLESGDHLLFTHGGVIRLLVRGQTHDARIEPGSVTRLVWEE